MPATRLAHLHAPRTVADPPGVLQVDIAADTDRRDIRTRLVRCGQELPKVLRLGPEWAAHPAGGPLIVDAMRLGLPVVEVVVDPEHADVVRKLVRRKPIPPTRLVLWLRGPSWDVELIRQASERGIDTRTLTRADLPAPPPTHRWEDAAGLVAVAHRAPAPR